MNIFVFFICYTLRSYEQISWRGLYETKSRITHGKSFSVKGQKNSISGSDHHISKFLLSISGPFWHSKRRPFSRHNISNRRSRSHLRMFGIFIFEISSSKHEKLSYQIIAHADAPRARWRWIRRIAKACSTAANFSLSKFFLLKSLQIFFSISKVLLSKLSFFLLL